jgi:acyl carrier protein
MPVRDDADARAAAMPGAASGDALSPRIDEHPLAGNAEIRAWVVRRVATVLAVSESAVDTGASFVALGFDSVTLFSMTGELAERLDRDLPASLLFEVSSIDELLAALAMPDGGRAPV